MQDIDYDKLALQELEKLQKDVTRALATYHSRVRKEAKAKLDEVVKEFGFSSADELFSGKPTRTKRNTAPIFRNPEDHSQVCGRPGRKPKWFKALLENGYTEKQLLIENQKDEH